MQNENIKKEPSFVNELVKEKSPYLRQHAYNPVNWYPWGEKAFKKARDEGKPIFLSIGYATCHWCHIMAHESFEDAEVAMALNDTFVCVKIDREELPEVDSLYMELAQTMIWGSAGWPLNLVLTPDLKPFFASTYLPKRSSRGIIGVIELAEKIKNLWNSDEQERLILQADKMVGILGSHIHLHGTDIPSEDFIGQTAEILFKIADPIWGGMQGAPKFPLGYQSNFLIHYYLLTQEARALFLVEKTLDMMHRGGIYDHLGGGFHRYSVDRQWHIPHFEKMLYDNAILSYAYLEAWKVTKRPLYKEICEEILNYVARDMQHFEGGFYSAEDADSEGREGFFYTWTRQEVVDLLGEERGALFCDFYTIFDQGIIDGRSVVHLNTCLEEFAEIQKIPPEECEQLIIEAKNALFKKRSLRARPFRDEKIITSWNGLMIHAFAEAGFALGREDYSLAAVRAAQFIKKNLWKDGHLMRRFCDGEAKYLATLDDYAFLIRGLLSLFETGYGTEWLTWAIELTEVLEDKFRVEGGAFYQADVDNEHLLIRKGHFSDGAEPSGNAIQTENLLRLYQITANKTYLVGIEHLLKAVNSFITTYSLGYCYHLIALQRYYDKNKATYVIALNEKNDLEAEIKEVLADKKPSHNTIVWLHQGDTVLRGLIGSDKTAQNGKTTLYICYEGVCKAPLTEKEAILQLLKI